MFTVAMQILNQRQHVSYWAAKTDFELSVPCVSALSHTDLFGHRPDYITKCMKCFTTLSLLKKMFPSYCFNKEENRNLTCINDTLSQYGTKGNTAALCYCYWLWQERLSKHSVTAGRILQNGVPRAKVNFVTPQWHSISLPPIKHRSALTLPLGQEWKWLLASSHLRCGKIL